MNPKSLTITLPDLGEGIENATIAAWLVKPGDRVTQDDDLVEVVTDKASFNVPAGAIGTVKQLLAAEGEVVKVGQALAVIAAET